MKDKYTSTGIKLIYHTGAIERIKFEKTGTPISLQVGPTSRCNLNCSFCSNAKRTMHEDLKVKDLIGILGKLRYLGLRTVEWTGGGDPTMYDGINNIIDFASSLGLEQGMITNGILLKHKISIDNLNRLKWLRISMNCLDYFSHVDIPKINGTLGFSYVMNDLSNEDIFTRLDHHIKKHKPKYVRIVPNCLATIEEQKENNRKFSALVKKWGSPYFYQEKIFDHPNNCYWGYFKPFLLHDGYVYPCSSVVLNSGAEGKFHEKFRWCKMEELPFHYKEEMVPFSTENCDHCVFKGQNDLVEFILNPEMENFI